MTTLKNKQRTNDKPGKDNSEEEQKQTRKTLKKDISEKGQF